MLRAIRLFLLKHHFFYSPTFFPWKILGDRTARSPGGASTEGARAAWRRRGEDEEAGGETREREGEGKGEPAARPDLQEAPRRTPVTAKMWILGWGGGPPYIYMLAPPPMTLQFRTLGGQQSEIMQVKSRFLNESDDFAP